MQNFLFGPYPITMQLADNILFYSALAAIVITLFLWGILFFRKLYPIQQQVLSKFRNLFLTYGLVGLFWSWLRFENAPYLRWRFWFALLVVGILAWLVKILIFVFKNYGREVQRSQKEELKAKYFKKRRRK